MRRAVDICRREAALKDCVYSWGKIIHNELVVEELEREGMHPVESLEQVPAGATLIIRAHGAVPELFGLCRERGIETVDATCPFVKRIHKIVEEESKKGTQIMVIGNPAHPEVVGIAGCATARQSSSKP